MATRIVITSPKGGDGRTTVALNVGFAMARDGARVLLADLDPTSGVSAHLGSARSPWIGIADYLMGRIELDRAVKASNVPTLNLLPIGRLDPWDEAAFVSVMSEHEPLESLFAAFDADHDVILVDVPAGTGAITRSALGVATMTLPVIKADALSQRLLPRLLYFLERVQQEQNAQLEVLGMLPTMTDSADAAACAVVESLRIQYLRIQDFQVPQSPHFAESAQRGQPLDPAHGRAFAEFRVFEHLATTLLRRIAAREREDRGEVVVRTDLPALPAVDTRAFLPFQAPMPISDR